jgi:hypothetical protein
MEEDIGIENEIFHAVDSFTGGRYYLST